MIQELQAPTCNRKRSGRALTWLQRQVPAIALACIAFECAAAAPAAPAPDALVPAPDAIAPFDLSDTDRIAAGRRRFNKNCAGYCHGYEGVGGRAPDFRGRTDLPAEAAFRTISEGRRGADVMPPWGNAYSAEQIWELVAYLMHLGAQR